MKKLEIENKDMNDGMRRPSEMMARTTARPVSRTIEAQREQPREVREQVQIKRPSVRRGGVDWMRVIFMLVILASVSFAIYFYYKLHNLEKNTPAAIAQKETDDLLAKVAKIYLIPTGEEPTVATVSDPNALKDQSFFSLSEKGDKVLIFTKAGRAILYRPSINKIIETAPINNNATQTPTTTTTPASTTKDKPTF